MTGADITIQVLLPLPHTKPFDYLAPIEAGLRPGSFVKIPFRKHEAVGIVWAMEPSALESVKLRTITASLPLPPLLPSMLEFIRRVADYTFSSYGAVLKMVMPLPLGSLLPKEQVCYGLGTIGAIRMTEGRERVIAALRGHLPKPLEAILSEAQVNAGVVQSLKRLGVLKITTLPIAPAPADSPVITLAALSGMQAEAANYLHQKIEEDAYSVTLLDGVTGSGKTEVYFAAIADILSQETGQVLILLPEIALTTQLISRFEERFGFVPKQWHSEMGEKARKEIWRGVMEGGVRLVIGARSALFLPFSSLSLIVVDEEHESAYKQEEGVLYHARDMAILRAHLGNIPIILASATPSLETVLNIQLGKFARLHLPSRHGAAVLPHIETVDIRAGKLPKNTWISPMLRTALAETLAHGQQSMLFLNRRGYAPLTLCQDCGHRMTCPHCSSWMVEHRSRGRIECHHCGYGHAIPVCCPACGKKGGLVACGPGVERVAEEVQAFLPGARVMVMAKDTVKSIAVAESMINAILNREVDIIIGTQMIAKGHHFPSLTLVGVIDADLGLAGGDLRAAERTYQLLHQVSGRAGREESPGKVILQSYMPDNVIIQALLAGNRDAFIAGELENRQESGMPPFSRLAAVIVSGENERDTADTAKRLARSIPATEGIEVLGPAPAILYQLRGKYRHRFLVKASRIVHLQKWLRHWLKNGATSSVHVKVDIDPYNFF